MLLWEFYMITETDLILASRMNREQCNWTYSETEQKSPNHKKLIGRSDLQAVLAFLPQQAIGLSATQKIISRSLTWSTQ